MPYPVVITADPRQNLVAFGVYPDEDGAGRRGDLDGGVLEVEGLSEVDAVGLLRHQRRIGVDADYAWRQIVLVLT